MIAYLYTYNGKLNKIYKDLTPFQIPQIEFTFKTPYNELNPTIVVKIPYNTIEGVNYIKLDYYGYTVTSLTAINKKLTKIYLSYDFVSNIKIREITNSYGFINRYGGAVSQNGILYDEKLPLSIENDVETIYLNDNVVYDIGDNFVYVIVSSTNSPENGISPLDSSRMYKIPYGMTTYRNILIYRMTEAAYKTISKTFLSDTTLATFILGIYKAPKFISEDSWYSTNGDFYYGDGKVAYVSTAIDGEVYLLKNAVYTKSYIIDYFKTKTYNFYDLEPISTYQLFLPLYGFVDISRNAINGKYLRVIYDIDFTTFTLGIIVLAYTETEDDGSAILTLYTDFGAAQPLTYNNSADVERQTKANNMQLVGSIVGAVVGVGVGLATGNAGLAMGMAANGLMGLVRARNAEKDIDIGAINSSDITTATDYENQATQSRANARMGGAIANGANQIAQAGIQYYTHQLFNLHMGGGNISGGGTYLKFFQCQQIYVRRTTPKKLPNQSEEVYKKMVGYPMQQFCSDLSQYINENNKGLFISISDFNFADNVIGLTLDKLQGLQAALEIGVEI